MNFDLAYEMAQEGKTNAEIFGALEISAGSLVALLQTRPQLVFNMINGRSKYCEPYLDQLALFADGEEVMTKSQYSAIVYLLERAEQQNKVLTIAHEMALLAGSPAPSEAVRKDPGTVTALLRAAK